mgnify:CR=1 FL=1
MENIEIRNLIARKRFKYWEIAAAIGICPYSLSKWMRQPLTDERKSKILAAIEKLEKQYRQQEA